MPRLLTDDQVRFIVAEHLDALVGEIYGCRPLEMSSDGFGTQVREALEEKLVEGLEGLMDPDEGETGA